MKVEHIAKDVIKIQSDKCAVEITITENEDGLVIINHGNGNNTAAYKSKICGDAFLLSNVQPLFNGKNYELLKG